MSIHIQEHNKNFKTLHRAFLVVPAASVEKKKTFFSFSTRLFQYISYWL